MFSFRHSNSWSRILSAKQSRLQPCTNAVALAAMWENDKFASIRCRSGGSGRCADRAHTGAVSTADRWSKPLPECLESFRYLHNASASVPVSPPLHSVDGILRPKQRNPKLDASNHLAQRYFLYDIPMANAADGLFREAETFPCNHSQDLLLRPGHPAVSANWPQQSFSNHKVFMTPATSLLREASSSLVTPSFSAHVNDGPLAVENGTGVWCMNRNARRGKRANRGQRAVSRMKRRAKRRAFGNHRR
jgi:hypothetical protein